MNYSKFLYSSVLNINLMDCKEIKRNSVARSLLNKITHSRICKCQATYFGHVRRRERRTSCDNWNDRKKRQQGKKCEKMFDGLTKWSKVGQVTEALKETRDRDAWKVMITYAKEHGA